MGVQSEFDHAPPRLPEARLAELAAALYGLQGHLSPLDSERDQNVLVGEGSDRAVLKIANAAEDRAVIELQIAALDHIAAVDPGLPVPRVIRSKAGDAVTEIAGASETNAVRLMSFLPGQLYSSVPKTLALDRDLGRFMGRLSRALQGFGHPAAFRPGFMWNLDTGFACGRFIGDIADPERRALVTRHFDRTERRLSGRLDRLRAAIAHQDANDNNIIVSASGAPAIAGLIDFGDLCHGRQINELAVSLAYGLLGSADLAATAEAIIGGYVSAFPIMAEEADVLFDLVTLRLLMSVCISSNRSKAQPENAYLLVSQAPAFALLERLDRINPELLACLARHAAGLEAVPNAPTILHWLSSNDVESAPLFDFDVARAPRMLLRLTQDAPGMLHAADPHAYERWLSQAMQSQGAAFSIGIYGEDRDVYRGPQFVSALTGGRRSRHMGLDLFVPAGTPLKAPIAGTVLSVVDNDRPYEYGPTVIVEHRAGEAGPPFWTLYGHLARSTLATILPGQKVAAGERIGAIGDASENGGWAPHLHFQIMTDRLGLKGEFPGVAEPELWTVWSRIVPDPNFVLKLAPESFVVDATPPSVLIGKRSRLLGPSLSVSYRNKLKIVRGRGAYLYDHTGRAYLDCVNNIAHVGHAHPRVVEALAGQAAVLNTNTRYLHDLVLDYADRLTALLPKPLSVVFLVTSGSEANELALRMARTVTGRRDIVCVNWGYHGHTSAMIEASPYKFNRKGGRGKPDDVEIAMLPDPYRGPFKGERQSSGLAYARSVAEAIDRIRARTGSGPAAFIAESISGCGGQVIFPKGYFEGAFALVRDAGGLTIVDEVQTGFGRVGSKFWAFELQGVVPDIVTLGKPIGNGHPMAAVITTPEIARSFANGMEFFSSFGGNPVSAAVGLAVLDVIRDEDLQENARVTGTYLKERLRIVAERAPLIGDVRGEGLFIGVDLVEDREMLTPATAAAADVINRMRERGVLVSTDGPFDNVLKIKPPMVFGRREADILADELEAAIQES